MEPSLNRIKHSSYESKRRWGSALLLTLVVHAALLWFGLGFWDDWEREIESERTRSTEETLLSFQLPPLPQQDEVEREDQERPMQMVSLPPPPEDEARRPEEADYQDRFDRSVERETVNSSEQTSPEAASSQDEASGVPEVRDQSSSRTSDEPSVAVEVASEGDTSQRDEETRATDSETESEEPAEQETATSPSVVAEVPLPLRENGQFRQSQGPREQVDATEAPQETTAGVLSGFLPTSQTIGDFGGRAVRRNDHIDEEEGEVTALNTRTSRYWSFFHRVQELVSREWNPNRPMRMNDPTGTVYGTSDRLTVLEITLNADGTLHRAWVNRQSGLRFLDDEALRAVEAAAPFHRVPSGLIDESGRCTFEFSFFFDLGRRRARIRRI